MSEQSKNKGAKTMGQDFECKAENKNKDGVEIIRGLDEDTMSEMVEKYGFAGVLLNLQDQLDTEQEKGEIYGEEDGEEDSKDYAKECRRLKNKIRILILEVNKVFIP